MVALTLKEKYELKKLDEKRERIDELLGLGRAERTAKAAVKAGGLGAAAAAGAAGMTGWAPEIMGYSLISPGAAGAVLGVGAAYGIYKGFKKATDPDSKFSEEKFQAAIDSINQLKEMPGFDRLPTLKITIEKLTDYIMDLLQTQRSWLNSLWYGKDDKAQAKNSWTDAGKMKKIEEQLLAFKTGINELLKKVLTLANALAEKNVDQSLTVAQIVSGERPDKPKGDEPPKPDERKTSPPST